MKNLKIVLVTVLLTAAATTLIIYTFVLPNIATQEKPEVIAMTPIYEPVEFVHNGKPYTAKFSHFFGTYVEVYDENNSRQMFPCTSFDIHEDQRSYVATIFMDSIEHKFHFKIAFASIIK